MQELVSIIMGVYNGANSLSQAIDSLIAQTYIKWELIACDDCSTDDTSDILAKYAKINKPVSSLIAAIPATFMSAVSCTYILYAEEGFHLSKSISYPIGLIFAAICLALFLIRTFIPAVKANNA